MRAVVQRVLSGQVCIDEKISGKIEAGLLVYLSVGTGDSENDAVWMAEKIVNLRIFGDSAGKMNLSVTDVDGSILVVSNFTLHGNCQKGRRPSFDSAADPTLANDLYEKTCELIERQGVPVQKGVFAAHMHVTSTNDGPLNFIIDSQK